MALILFLGASCANIVVIAGLAHDEAKLFTIADAQVPLRSVSSHIEGNVQGAGALGLSDGRRRGLRISWLAGLAVLLIKRIVSVTIRWLD